MKLKLLLPALLFTALIISCNKNSEQSPKDTLNDPGISQLNKKLYDQTNTRSADSAHPARQPGSNENPAALHASNADWDRKLIKTATVNLEVKDFKKYSDFIYKTVKQFGAYVAEEEQNITAYESKNTMVIKVPVAQFEDMMNLLPGADTKIIERKIATEDVGAEVADVQGRLEAKKQMRLKYLDFLKQSKNMEEVLQVQSNIDNIQETIEAAAGRISYLNHQSSMSTIRLSFYQPLEGYKPADADPSFLTRIANAFRAGAQWMSALLVGLVSIWPLLLIIGIVILLYKKYSIPKRQPIRSFEK